MRDGRTLYVTLIMIPKKRQYKSFFGTLGGGGVLDLLSLAMFDYIWCFLFLVCSIFQVAMGKLVSLQRAVTGWRIEARRLKL